MKQVGGREQVQPQEVGEGGGRKGKERVLTVLDPEDPDCTRPPPT